MDLEWRSESSKLVSGLWSWERLALQLVKASACVVLATSGEKVGSSPSHLPPREGEHWMATAKTGHHPRLLAHPVQPELKKKSGGERS